MQRVRRQGLSFDRQWKSDARSTGKTASLARPASAAPATLTGATESQFMQKTLVIQRDNPLATV